MRTKRPRGNYIPGLNPHWNPLAPFSRTTRGILRRREKEPLAASPQDERNLRQMRDALKLYDCEGADAWSIAAMLRRHRVRHPGTAGSWAKRLRRLALLGWAKRKRNGTWELTAAGRKAAAS